MKDDQLVIDPFIEKWRGKYPITWCDLCNAAIIICSSCHNSSCNGGGCDNCINDQDYKDFCDSKTNVENYLTEEERVIYDKCLRIKKHILDTLSKGESQINWKELKERGELSRWEEDLLKSFLL